MISTTPRAADSERDGIEAPTADVLHVDYDPVRDGDLLAYARRIAQPFSPAPLSYTYVRLSTTIAPAPG